MSLCDIDKSLGSREEEETLFVFLRSQHSCSPKQSTNMPAILTAGFVGYFFYARNYICLIVEMACSVSPSSAPDRYSTEGAICLYYLKLVSCVFHIIIIRSEEAHV